MAQKFVVRVGAGGCSIMAITSSAEHNIGQTFVKAITKKMLRFMTTSLGVIGLQRDNYTTSLKTLKRYIITRSLRRPETR
jgi:hypothetical protein